MPMRFEVICTRHAIEGISARDATLRCDDERRRRRKLSTNRIIPRA